MKIALGSAQFGLNYGITNNAGKVEDAEVKKILTYARKNNINCIDTAIDYGESQECLGRNNIKGWRVVTLYFR